jgi:tRNA pseudouridine38-40 synthase
MRIKLTIAYDGTRYSGWQVQRNALSIQTLVQKALETVLRHPIKLTGAGRTDAGVHALGQTAHFDTDQKIDLEKLCYSANALLPLDIRIMAAIFAPCDFHARYSAIGKIYHYYLSLEKVSDPTTRLYRTFVRGAFDREALQTAALRFLGTHDFAAFANEQKKGIAARDSIRTLQRLDIVDEPGGIRLEFEGTGFLYKMVRNITGTLLQVASGKRRAEEITALIESKDRRRSGPPAPPQGLFLIQVKY